MQLFEQMAQLRDSRNLYIHHDLWILSDYLRGTAGANDNGKYLIICHNWKCNYFKMIIHNKYTVLIILVINTDE